MQHAVCGADLEMEVGAAGSAGVAGGKDLGSSGDGGTRRDVSCVAVAVGPAGSLVVFDGDADATGLAAC